MSAKENVPPPTGVAEMLEPGLRRILAPNPSPMTYHGTNTYLVGESHVAVIDPGPDSPAHLSAILNAVNGQKVEAILVTHSHLDHSPLSRALSERTAAPVMAYGDSRSGRSQLMEKLAASGLVKGGEGVDPAFAPDVMLADNQEIKSAEWSLRALWTPGHLGNHLSFAWGSAVFTGDHVMGWASSLVSPPDGDLTAFMASCARLAARNDRIYYPGHGAPVTEPKARIDWLINHRHSREAEILRALSKGPQSVKALTADIYTDVPDALLGAAARNVFAHLIDLSQRSLVKTEGELAIDAVYSLI